VYKNPRTGLWLGNCPRCAQRATLKWFVLAIVFGILSLPLQAQSEPANVPNQPQNIQASAPTDSAAPTPNSTTPQTLAPPIILSAPSAPNSKDESSESSESSAPSVASLDSTQAAQPDSQPALQKMQSDFVLDIDTNYFYVQLASGLQFINFDSRALFERDMLVKYDTLLAQARTLEDTLRVRTQRQAYSKVNLAFPLQMSLHWHFAQDHYAGIGAAFVYNRESAILTDRSGKSREQYYALQAFPLFIEYRRVIPGSVATIKEKSEFSVFFRWYWLLPGTEIYSNNGVLTHQTKALGDGWGLFLGYKSATWKQLSLQGKLGYISLQASSNAPWQQLIPQYEGTEAASWDLGGLSIEVGVAFHFWPYNAPSSLREQAMQSDLDQTTSGQATPAPHSGDATPQNTKTKNNTATTQSKKDALKRLKVVPKQ
jgi:hypothetical protein